MDTARLLAQIFRPVKLVATSDDKQMQVVEVAMEGGEEGHIARLQQYGLTSHAMPNAQGVAVTLMGHRFVFALDDNAQRPTGIKAGEVMLWHQNGDFLHLQEGNKVALQTNDYTVNAANSVTYNTTTFDVNASSAVTLNTPSTTVTGQSTFGGLATFLANIIVNNVPFIGHGHTNVRSGSSVSGQAVSN